MIGLAPMDGVTDAAFRLIVDKYGHPDLLFTEFVSVDGLLFGKPKLYNKLIYHQTNTPLIAQLFGSDPEYFYSASLILCVIGFSDININMGCPDKNIVKRGAGAALIMQPTKARAIIRAVKKAINDFSTNGDKKSYFREEILFWLKNYACFSQPNRLTNKISLSIKTRLAPTKHTHDEWLKNLLAEEPDLIIIHGRTVAQLYGGKVNWEAIGKAVKLAGKGVSKIIGNGDIRSRQEAQEKIKQYQLAGVLIGRAALGNPWVFRDYSPSLTEKIAVMLEHCRQFKRLTPELNFLSLRKHLLWYLKGFKNGHSLKKKLAQATSINQVEEIIKQEYF